MSRIRLKQFGRNFCDMSEIYVKIKTLEHFKTYFCLIKIHPWSNFEFSWQKRFFSLISAVNGSKRKKSIKTNSFDLKIQSSMAFQVMNVFYETETFFRAVFKVKIFAKISDLSEKFLLILNSKIYNFRSSLACQIFGRQN